MLFGPKKVSKKSENAIGVDIGNFAVKVVQISRQGQDITLEGFGYCKINHSKLEGVSEAVKSACAEAKLTGKKVNTAINSEGAIVRYLMLPSMGQDDLKRAMEFEVERYVPFDKKDVISDYLILSEKADTKNMKVLLVAAKKDFIEDRVKVLRDAGFEAEVVTIDSIVLRNIFQANYPDKNEKTIGILNIGAKVSNISIIREGVSYFMRDVQLGGESITQLLKEKMDIDVEEAEKMKCSLASDDKEKFKIVEPVLGNLLNEVYLSFDYYESEFGMAVDEVFVCGGTAKLVWLKSFLKENLNREVTVLNTTHTVKVSPLVSTQRLEIFSSSLAVAFGLALENLD